MPLIDLNESNFDDESEKHQMMILDFWALWCGPCKLFHPIFEAAAERHPDILFGRIDSDTEQLLSQQFSIFSVPTIIGTKDGTIFFARPGALTAEKLEALVTDLRAWNQDAP